MPTRPSHFFQALTATALATLLAGCAAGRAPIEATPQTAIALSGRAMGGQQPVVGATVALMAPGQTGYGSTPTVLASTITGVGGNFTLPAHVCPAVDTITYLMVTGGDSGSGPNTALGEAILLPKCSTLLPSTFVNVTEVTTVTAAYALAPFAIVSSTGTPIGTSPGNIIGLNNAFGPANNLASYSNGGARVSNSIPGLTLPSAAVNTLANILAACVNTAGSTAANANCGKLFAATTVNGVAPIDTFQAALNIALHPGANVAALFALAASNPPYPAALTNAPADFALAIAYTGNGIAQATTGIAIDSSGNAWISTGEFSNTVHTLTEISPAGVYLSGTSGFGSNYINGPEAVVINSIGQVYVACAGGNNLVKFDNLGNYISTINAASFHNPNGASIGAADNIWISSYLGNAFTRIDNTTQTENPSSPFASGTEGVEIVNSETGVWVANYQSNSITHLTYGTFALNNYNTTSTPSGLAVDANDNVYVGLNYGVAKYSDAGQLLSPSAGFKTSTTFIPQSIVLDGLGNVFTSAYIFSNAGGSLLEFSPTGAVLSPSAGYTAGNTIPVKPQVPVGMAIDGSGNVWITGDSGNSSTTPTVAEIIGIAAPIVTPRASAVTSGTIAQRP